MTFMAHTETNRKTYQEVLMAPCPTGTDTWSPLKHGDLVQVVEKAIEDNGMRVVNRDFSMDEKGLKLFGTFDLDQGDSQQGFQLGVRNANDKAFAVGLTAGSRVFVCDNMAFDGDFLEFHKHTSGLTMKYVREMARRAVMELIPRLQAFVEWRRNLHGYYIDHKQFTYDLISNGVISGGQFNNYMDCLEEECRIDNWSGSLAGVKGSLGNSYEAATRLMRPWSLLRTSQATSKLHALAESYIH